MTVAGPIRSNAARRPAPSRWKKLASGSRGFRDPPAGQRPRAPGGGVRVMALRDDPLAVGAGLDEQRRPGVGERVAGERLGELPQVPDVPTGSTARALAGDDEDPLVLPGVDQRVGDLQGVQHGVAGVLHVEHRAGGTERRGDDVRGGGFDEVLGGGGEQQQVDVVRAQPGLGEQLLRGGHGEVGRLPVVGHHVTRPDAGGPLDDPPWGDEARAARHDPLLRLCARDPRRRQVRRHGPDPCPHVLSPSPDAPPRERCAYGMGRHEAARSRRATRVP